MKHNYVTRFAILLTCLVFSSSSFADVKIKARMTTSGQTTENTTYIKGKRQRTEQNIGEMQMVNLTQCDLKRTVQLNPQTQMYILNSWEQDENSPTTTTNNANTTTLVKKGSLITTTITIKDTGETRKMFGYNARHLIITMETESSADACSFQPKSKMVTDGWYIDAAFALDCDYGYRNYGTSNRTGGCQDKYNVKQIGTAKRGYPVLERMTMFDENGKETFTMQSEVIELANATLDASLFEIPNGWREAKNPSDMYASTTSSTTMSSQSSQSNSSLNSSISNINSQNKNAVVEITNKNQLEKKPTDQPPPKQIVTMLALFAGSVRSEGKTNELKLAQETTGANLQLNLESQDYKIFRAEIVDQDGKIIFRSGKLSPRNATLYTFVSTLKLENGDYIVKVYGKNDENRDESAADFTFRVSRK